MNKNLIPEIPNTTYHKAVHWLCIAMQAGTVLLLLLVWNRLPERVPMHYNAAGEIDSYGRRWTVWIVPVCTVLMYQLLYLVERHPRWWNTSVTITRENSGRVYATLKNMLVSLKFIVILLFTYMSIGTIKGSGIGKWFLPVSMTLTFAPMIVFGILLIKSSKKKR